MLEEQLRRIKNEKQLRLVKMRAGYELLQHDVRRAKEGFTSVKESMRSLKKISDKTESPRNKLKNIFWNFSLEVIYKYLRRK